MVPSFEQGFIPKNRMMELERTIAALGGQRGEDLANLGKAKAQIAESRQRIVLAKQNYMKEVETLHTETRRQVDDLKQRLLGLNDDLEHATVRAPVSGIVSGLTVKTEGGGCRSRPKRSWRLCHRACLSSSKSKYPRTSLTMCAPV